MASYSQCLSDPVLDVQARLLGVIEPTTAPPSSTPNTMRPPLKLANALTVFRKPLLTSDLYSKVIGLSPHGRSFP